MSGQTYRVRLLTVSVLLGVAACAGPPTQEQSGMIIGGMLGSVLGSQMEHGRGSSAATILGTLAGVMIGGAIGRSMDDADRRKTAHVLENVQTGVPGEWVNPDTGYRYRVVPTRTYDSQDGPCREYEVDALIRGRTEKVYGKACRERDGTWRVAD